MLFRSEEEGNPTTNARNFQFLVCLNDSFSLGILFQENAIMRWVLVMLELQEEALDMYNIWDRSYYVVKNVVDVAYFSLFSCFLFDKKMLFYLLVNILGLMNKFII